MAEWASGLDRGVARVFGENAAYGALATLIGLDEAITPASVVDRIPPGEVLTVEFLDLPQGKATVARLSPETGFAFLQIRDIPVALRPVPVARRAPRPGDDWLSFVITKDGEGGIASGRVMGEGYVDGHLHLTLQADVREDLLAQGSAGAPVVVDGDLVGLIASGKEGTWYALPVPRQSQIPDGDARFARLTTAARRVLARAEGIRVVKGDDHIRSDALVAGLLAEQDGPVARAFRAAGIDWARFAEIAAAANHGTLPDPDGYRPVPLTEMPAGSSHVDQALAFAFDRASSGQGTQVQTTDLLAGMLSVSDCWITTSLRDAGLDRRLAEHLADLSRPIADYRSDAVAGPDALGIDKDVRILASVLVAKDVEPPLALGLFGEWGSGKSFFMRELAAYIEVLKQDARHSGGSAFCENVVQLTFNAWNYIDTDLWASLTSEIFEGLARELDREAYGVDHARQRLLAAAASTRDVLAEAQRAKSLAEEDLRVSEERLARLREEAARSPRTIARAAYRVAAQQPEVRDKVQNAAHRLGVPPDRVLELGGQRGGFVRAMARAVRERRLALTILIVAALGVVLAVAAGEALAALATAAGGAALALGPLVPLVTRGFALARDARAAAEDEISRATRTFEDQRNDAANKLADADQRVDDAARRVESLSRELDELRADREMSDFVRQRTLSEDYTRHLGVISRARKDFEQLSRLLAAVREEGPVPGPRLPKIDRIVLYIDDLDRCPENKVVDVIQAVHLLLAFPLFVVVVGVDARWLLHSLQQFSPAFQGPEPEEDESDVEALHWRSTPLNYLEKIFQIPFTLRPMTPTGFASLIDSMASSWSRSSDGTGKATEPPRATPTAGDVVPGEAQPAPTTTPTGPPEDEPTERPSAPGSSPAVDRDPGFLRLEGFELACVKQLYPLMPSPRAAKRLVNVYRLIRAGMPESEREEFIGDETRGGHRAVLLLLAVVSSYPVEGGELLRELIIGEHPETWWTFVESFKPRTERWQEVRDQLGKVRSLIPEDEPCSTFVDWAPEVARFSFYSGRVFAPVPQRDGVSETSTNSDSSM